MARDDDLRGRLGNYNRRDDAERHVLEVGLASLAERWTLFDAASGEEQVVCIQQVSPSSVTLALGYYSLPGADEDDRPQRLGQQPLAASPRLIEHRPTSAPAWAIGRRVGVRQERG